MPVITIEGSVGSYAPEISRSVASKFNIDFVDRLLLAEVARRVGTTVQRVSEAEQLSSRLVDRLSHLVQRMLERSAMTGAGDPYFGPGVEALLSRPYRELDDPAEVYSGGLNNQKFIDTTAEVIRDIAEEGSVVILSRGGAAILRERDKVLRVGIVADLKDRIHRIAVRENLDSEGAMAFLENSDRAQNAYFKKAFGSNPSDPFLYNIMINTSDVSVETAVDLISDLALNIKNKNSG